MRNIYRVSAGGYWTVVNAASFSAAVGRGLRILEDKKHLVTAHKKGYLSMDVQIVERGVSPMRQPTIEEYEGKVATP